jgi:hypothetical protein
MELSIAAVESSSLPMQKLKRNKLKGHIFKKSAPKVNEKQSLVINFVTEKVSTIVKRNDCATFTTFQKSERKKSSLKK